MMIPIDTISNLAIDTSTIAATLRQAGYTTENIIRELGVPDQPEGFLANSALYSMMFFDGDFGSPLVVLAKLLVLQQAIPAGVYAREVPPALQQVLDRHQLVTTAEGLTAARVCLVEYGGHLFFADPLFENREGIPQLLARDSVQTMPPHASTFDVLRSVANIRPSGRLLDVGSGCGVLGICLAARCAAVDTIDINPRSVAWSGLNARLNEIALGATEADCMTLTADVPYDTVIFNSPSEIGYVPQEGVSTGYGDDIVFAFARERLGGLLGVGGRFASWLIGARRVGFRDMHEMVQRRLQVDFDHQLELVVFPASPFSLSEQTIRNRVIPRDSFLLHSAEEAPLLLKYLEEHQIVEVSAMLMVVTRKG